MRMRRKKHLEERLAACGDMVIYMDRENRDYSFKDTENMLDLHKLFGNDNPVIMEIGCGKGQFVCELAKRDPQYNYIAVEKASNVVVDAAARAIEEGLTNVRFLRGGAEYLDCYVPEHSAERIYLNFSCPFPKKSYAAVVVAHPNGGSKDQVAGLYAQRLAEAGMITIAFDARYQGESGGEPRRTDKPFLRMGDIMGAIDYIQQFPGVDRERIGAFGICGGGGYTFATAQVDKRIKAVGTLSLFNTGDVRRNGYMRTQMSTTRERQREVSLARQREAAGEEPEMAGFMNWTPEEARKIKVDLYRDGYFYYSVTHRSPNAPGTYLKSSLMDMMAWDATDHADLIDQPLLIIAGEIADSRYMSEEAFAKANGTADKELFIVPGATHIRTYFVKEYVEKIAAKIQNFFTQKL